MEKSSDKDQEKKKVYPITTFTVPLALEENQGNISINIPSKGSKEKIIKKAIQFHLKGNINEAINYYQQIINQGCNDYRVFSNYGIILRDLGNFQEAELLYREAIKLKPNYAEAHSNLGSILINLGDLDAAALHTRKAIELNPALAEAHSNLGSILRGLGNLQEAELSTRKAIELDPDLAEAHSNLGGIFRSFGNLQEAELSYRKAIELKPNRTLYLYYGSCLFSRKEFEAAKKTLSKAHLLSDDDIRDPILNASESAVDLAIKKSIHKSKADHSKNSKISHNQRFERLIINRPVEVELISYLYSLKNRKLECTRDSRFGEGITSVDFELFNDTSQVVKELVDDISKICKEALQLKKIFFIDSFFNIFVSGCGQPPHAHRMMTDQCFDLHLHKYSLVYYLDIGDQTGKDPGLLKLYKPEEEILPTNGMIVIIDSKRFHSVSYRGNKDRIMIGVNFYGL